MKHMLMVLLLMVMAIPASAQTIECVGTESAPSQLTGCGTATKYAYKVTASSQFSVDTIFIGTHDGNLSHYTNICTPPGWTFDVVPVGALPVFPPQTLSDHTPKSAHGTVVGATGVCPFAILLTRGTGLAIAPSASYTFGYDNFGEPHDVDWQLREQLFTADWNQPLGAGLGPIHGPVNDSCYTDTLFLNSGLDHQGGVIPAPGIDPFWSVVYDPLHPGGHPTAAVVPSILWGPPEPNSQWIAAEPADNGFGAGGFSEFQFCFCLDSNLINPRLQIGIRVDNFADVFLNGALILSVQGANAWQAPPTFASVSGASSFFAGQNCIRVRVQNLLSSGGVPTPTGVDIVGWVVQNHNPGVGLTDCCDSCITCFADGDIDGDGSVFTVADLLALIHFVHGTGPAPAPLCRADMNGDGYIDDGDVEIMNCYFTYGSSCFPVLPVPTICNPDTVRGACCEVDSCYIRSEANCELHNGVYFGDGTACSPTFCWGEICGTKFNDLNGDGFQDPGEPPLGGVTISFVPPVAGVQNPVVTAPDGSWCFGPMPAGTYTFHETVPVGMAQTAPSTGSITTDVLPQLGVYAGAFGNEDSCQTERQHVDTCLAGRKDDFATGDGPELATPSPALCAFLQSTFPFGPLVDCHPFEPNNCSEFDCNAVNHGFGHTFSGCWDSTCTVVHAQLNLHIRSTIGDNDGIGFYQNVNGTLVGVWGIQFSSIVGWPGDVTLSLDLENLPPSTLGITNVLAALQDGDLDVVIQDDTEIDYLELIVTTCCNCVSPPSDMVAWWPLDETSGTTVSDIVGLFDGTAQPGSIGAYGGAGPVTSAAWPLPAFPTGMVGTSLFFYGDRLVEVPSNTALEPGTGDFSIDAWVIYAEPASNQLLTVAEKWGASGPGYRLIIQAGPGGNQLLFFQIGQFAVSPGVFVTFSSPNVWHHIAATLERGSSDILTLYVDGGVYGIPATLAPLGSVINTENLLIGDDGVSAGEIAVDELELFDRALGADELASIFDAGDLGKCRPQCRCQFQCDFDANGFIDALDLNGLIDALFFGGTNPQDPLCPTTRGDFNNDGAPDALDLNDLIDYLFFGGPPPADPCAP